MKEEAGVVDEGVTLHKVNEQVGCPEVVLETKLKTTDTSAFGFLSQDRVLP